ncbi:MAG: permease-like cell division protein FtsX [Candidatus Taylorbacteria bacterium]|nr:permease-like cell division protein FtsX [Candidatus Taylorbacteria bacterium]
MKESLKRIWQAGWKNFKRNSYLSLATTAIMVLVLLLFSALMGLNFLSLKIVSSLNEKVDVTVYFRPDASEDKIMVVRDSLQGREDVRGVEYISREKALEDFKANHAGDVLIQDSLAELDDNPLQASLNVEAVDPSQYASIVTYLEANQFRSLIDKINFYENERVINRVQNISGAIQNWGFTLTMALAFIAVLITFNTIRLTIYNQKQEIEIMRLVGGSNWHIKAPYLVEGGLYGVFAAVVTLVLFFPLVYLSSPKIEVLMPNASLMGYFVSNIFQYIFLVFSVGTLLGVVSSFIAIRRFLKV